MKKLPYEKTVVTEVKVQLADLYTRTVLLKSSAAAPVYVTDAFNTGDATVTQEKPLQIEGVKNCLVLSSFEDFTIVLRNPAGDTELLCRGMFIHNGPIDSMWVKPVPGATAARIQFIIS